MEYGLSLGSNLGNRLANLAAARRRIAGCPATRVTAASSVYETEAVDAPAGAPAPPFLNAVLIAESGLAPDALLVELQRIETDLGRARPGPRNAARTIDIDIVYADGLNLRAPALTVPHPRWAARRFVVQPLCDVRPGLRLPPAAGTVGELLLALPARPKVVLFTADW